MGLTPDKNITNYVKKNNVKNISLFVIFLSNFLSSQNCVKNLTNAAITFLFFTLI